MPAWQSVKGPLMALAVGLVAGPLIANSAGWTVWSGVAQAQVRAGFVEQGAAYCVARVRDEVSDPGNLDFDARSELAKKWTVAPGATSPDADITQACAFKLAN